MGYENLNDTINLLDKMFDTILKLQKWNGHLYNWYDIETLKPLTPKYVSTVDSGNFIGYLYTAKQFLLNINNKIQANEAIRENETGVENNEKMKIENRNWNNRQINYRNRF